MRRALGMTGMQAPFAALGGFAGRVIWGWRHLIVGQWPVLC